ELREATTALRTAEETLRLYGLSQAQIDTLRYDDPQASGYRLQAPFAGTIVERHATLGELVTPERSLFTLADLGAVWIWIDVYQRDLGNVHLGDGARIRVDTYPGEILSGIVSYLSAQVDVKTRTVRARVDVPNPERKLRPGMFVQVELADPHAAGGHGLRKSTRAVPESAVQRDGEELVVFVVAGANCFERREIRAGRRAGGWVELVDGPELGAEVVVEGSFLLKSAAAKESMGEGHQH
ncbi:MAG: efflux RND transporter periplasmic adaptor subunit, partial [bacterium]|nr:efflux RND transporter periplasmic adaptor subunit [bacterium]